MSIEATKDNSQLSEGALRNPSIRKELMDKQQKQNLVKAQEYKNSDKFNLKHVPSNCSNLKATDIFNENTSQRTDNSVKFNNKSSTSLHQNTKKIIR